MGEPQAVLSKQEEKFQHFRQRLGFILAPLLFLILWFIPIAGLSVEAHRLLAILGFVVIFWMTEAIPMPITALLGPTLCVIVGIDSAKNILQKWSNMDFC